MYFILIANFVIIKVCLKIMNFRYLDSAYIELSSDTGFMPKLHSLEGKTQSQRQHREKSAVPIYEV